MNKTLIFNYKYSQNEKASSSFVSYTQCFLCDGAQLRYSFVLGEYSYIGRNLPELINAVLRSQENSTFDKPKTKLSFPFSFIFNPLSFFVSNHLHTCVQCRTHSSIHLSSAWKCKVNVLYFSMVSERRGEEESQNYPEQYLTFLHEVVLCLFAVFRSRL